MTPRFRTVPGLLLVGLLSLPATQAQQVTAQVTTPLPGSATRQAILDAVRTPVGRFLGQPIIRFKVNELRVAGGWAFLQAQPMNRAGRFLSDPLSHAPEVWALLQQQQGRWQVRRWAMPTDVISEGWEQEFPKAPRGIWPQFRP